MKGIGHLFFDKLHFSFTDKCHRQTECIATEVTEKIGYRKTIVPGNDFRHAIGLIINNIS